MNPDFYLASRSPRRSQMLRAAGYRFECRPADLPETPLAGESPADFACRMAREKAGAVAARLAADDALPVLAADTDVAVDGRIQGKPRDRDEGIAMLLSLAGRSHQVHSAVVLRCGARVALASTCTEVQFGPVAADEAAAYWDSGEPADKAGGYAIQGAAGRWVRAIHGSYSGVVGLPLFETVELLRGFGLPPRAAPEDPAGAAA